MECSQHSSVLAIVRLLEHFNDENAAEFKQSLFEHLNLESESQFLCVVLKKLCKSLPSQSLQLLKEKAIQIAESQSVAESPNIPTCDNNENDAYADCSNINKISVYKYIQTKLHKSNVCRLPHDIIDHIGSYLNKIESIEFGYLNKQLYIETQKQSYLIKRENDGQFYLNQKMLNRLLWSQTNPYPYSFPTDLRMQFSSEFELVANNKYSVNECGIPIEYISIVSSHWFSTLFSRVTKLHCVSNIFLPLIPIAKLFNNSIFLLEYLHLCLSVPTWPPNKMYNVEMLNKNVDKFCTNYKNYFVKKCEKNINNIRHINQLKLTGSTRCHKDHSKRVAMVLSPNYCHLEMENSTIQIKTIEEILTIFHKNLISLSVVDTTFEFGDGNEKNVVTKLRNSYLDLNLNKSQNTRQLKYITIDTVCFSGYKQLFKILDIIDARVSVESYCISWDVDDMLEYLNGNISDDVTPEQLFDVEDLQLLDSIFYHDNNKHPNLKKLKMRLQDDASLHCLAIMFLYLIAKKEEILINGNIDTVEFEWPFFFNEEYYTDELFQVDTHSENQLFKYQVNNDDVDQLEMFDYSKVIENGNTIEIKCGAMDTQCFGVLYQNIFHYFQQAQNVWKSSDSQKINCAKLVCKIRQQ